jgi:hypothetical protein
MISETGQAGRKRGNPIETNASTAAYWRNFVAASLEFPRIPKNTDELPEPGDTCFIESSASVTKKIPAETKTSKVPIIDPESFTDTFFAHISQVLSHQPNHTDPPILTSSSIYNSEEPFCHDFQTLADPLESHY